MVHKALSCMLMVLIASAQAQTVTEGSWGSVQLLNEGQKMQVHRFGTDSVTGKFLSATPDAVVVRQRSGNVTVLRTDVREVRARQASRRLRNGAIGAAIGAGAAGGVTALAVRDDFGEGGGLGAGITFVLAMMGAGIGFVIGMLPPGYGPVYKATP
jgi:hypothetical protein